MGEIRDHDDIVARGALRPHGDRRSLCPGWRCDERATTVRRGRGSRRSLIRILFGAPLTQLAPARAGERAFNRGVARAVSDRNGCANVSIGIACLRQRGMIVRSRDDERGGDARVESETVANSASFSWGHGRGVVHDHRCCAEGRALSFSTVSHVINRTPVILEPVMDVEVVTPDDFMGPVMGDLQSKRGKIEGMELRGTAAIIRSKRCPF